jgi:hypothetical protein
MGILHRNVSQLGWGMLHYGIRAMVQTLGLHMDQTNVSLTNSLVHILSVMNLGENGEKQSEIPKFMKKTKFK